MGREPRLGYFPEKIILKDEREVLGKGVNLGGGIRNADFERRYEDVHKDERWEYWGYTLAMRHPKKQTYQQQFGRNRKNRHSTYPSTKLFMMLRQRTF